MQKTLTAAAVLVLAGIVVASGAAKNIGGTPANDVLHGTRAADVINGKGGNDVLAGLAGNDKLFGGAGNDKLVGGPGADNLNCGPGKDTAAADVRDKISASCEKVTGLPNPALSVADSSIAEGNAGASNLSFQVTLSRASTKTVSVGFSTSDGTASAPGDYGAASGRVTFEPGERTKAIVVDVVGDQVIEQHETFAIALASPLNASIARGRATGTITNDDTAAPVTAGAYRGATQNGNYVFFTVTPSRTVTAFRVNDLPEPCQPGGTLSGGEDFGDSTFPVRPDGSFAAEGRWDGSRVQGDIEWTHWDGRITGAFGTPTSAGGTILMNIELNYQGTHYRCSSGEVRWTASLQG